MMYRNLFCIVSLLLISFCGYGCQTAHLVSAAPDSRATDALDEQNAQLASYSTPPASQTVQQNPAALRTARSRWITRSALGPIEPSIDVSKEPLSEAEVVILTQRGEREDVIIDRIEGSGNVFKLTAADENRLRDRGVSSAVIRAMHETSRRNAFRNAPQ
jgi:hypothetical protein